MKVKVLNIEGKATNKTVDLADEIFGIEPNDHAIYLAVKQFRANKRQGTHKSKERAEVAGSTRKIKKQKGTGTARAGSIKSPIFRGGGTVFGPRPHKYGFKLNKKVKDLARKSALAYKAKAEDLIIIEDFKLDQPKTKEFSKILGNLNVNGQKSVLLIADKDDNVYLAGRNLPNALIGLASGMNIYDVMWAQKLIITESSIKKIEELFKN